MEKQIKNHLANLYEIYGGDYEIPDGQSLFSGRIGVFLFQLYYLTWKNESDESLEETLFSFLTNVFQKNSRISTFGNGTAGFAWFLTHLQKEGFIDLDDEMFEGYDAFVLASAKTDFEQGNHDFMHGGLGKMIYLIQRCQLNDKNREGVADLIEHLNENATWIENGCFWKEAEAFLAPDQKGETIVNMHMSHGQASKIAVLSACVQLNFTRAVPLLQAAVTFLLDSIDEDTQLIPHRLRNGEKQLDTHSGWCRSNIAVGLSLCRAAVALNDVTLMEKAIQIGKNTVVRETIERGRFSDAALCHGSAGISHMYQRYFKYTKVPLFQETAERWMKETLKAAIHEDGIAGFKSWHGMNQCFYNDYGFLTGAAGIGLAMLGFLSPMHSNWDEVMLLS